MGFCCIAQYDLRDFSPWFQVWSVGQQTGVVSLTNQTYIPAAALAIMIFLAFVWNPACRWAKLVALRLGPAELMLTTSLLILIPGIASPSLVNRWLSSMSLKSDLARQQSLDEYRYAAPQALSLSADKDLEQVISSTEDIMAELALPPVDQNDDNIETWLHEMRFYRISVNSIVPRDLPDDLRLNDDEAAAISAAIAGDQSVDGSIVNRIKSIHANASAELAFTTGIKEGQGEIGDLFTPTVEGGVSPFSRLLPVLIMTGVIIIGGLLMVVGLNAATARQWFHHERLQHPLAQVPGALSRSEIFSSTQFRIGVFVVLLIWLYQMTGPGQFDLHPLPPLGVGSQYPLVQIRGLHNALGLEVASGTNWVYNDWWATIRVFPIVIALAFLLPTDIGFFGLGWVLLRCTVLWINLSCRHLRRL